MKKLFFLFVLLIVSIPVLSQDQDLFTAANTAYGNGKYKEAISKYKDILDKGEASAELYFNLGNAHYKLNHIAPSIFYYEKALKLKPGDADIKNNIAFARNMAIDDIETVKRNGFSASINNFMGGLSQHSWAWLAVVGSLLFVGLFLCYYFVRKPVYKRLLLAGAAIAFIFSVFSVIIAFQQQNFIENNQFAIIFSEEAEVRNEPNLRSENAFVLHEGAKAKILENYQGWIKIELANGAQGWIKKEEVKEI